MTGQPHQRSSAAPLRSGCLPRVPAIVAQDDGNAESGWCDNRVSPDIRRACCSDTAPTVPMKAAGTGPGNASATKAAQGAAFEVWILGSAGPNDRRWRTPVRMRPEGREVSGVDIGSHNWSWCQVEAERRGVRNANGQAIVHQCERVNRSSRRSMSSQSVSSSRAPSASKPPVRPPHLASAIL